MSIWSRNIRECGVRVSSEKINSRLSCCCVCRRSSRTMRSTTASDRFGFLPVHDGLLSGHDAWHSPIRIHGTAAASITEVASGNIKQTPLQ